MAHCANKEVLDSLIASIKSLADVIANMNTCHASGPSVINVNGHLLYKDPNEWYRYETRRTHEHQNYYIIDRVCGPSAPTHECEWTMYEMLGTGGPDQPCSASHHFVAVDDFRLPGLDTGVPTRWQCSEAPAYWRTTIISTAA